MRYEHCLGFVQLFNNDGALDWCLCDSVATLNIILSYDNVGTQDRQLAKSTVLTCLSFFNQREKSPEFLLERFGLEWAGYMHGPRGSEAGAASERICEFSCGRALLPEEVGK